MLPNLGEHTFAMKQDLATELECNLNVDAVPVVQSELRDLARQWLESFCPNLKQQTGKWLYNGLRWHAYSFHFEEAYTGLRAWQALQAQPVEPFLLYSEQDDLMFACTAANGWPDLRPLAQDLYLFPHSMEWTFVTTHEMTLGLGPYFAFRPAGPPA